jgi:hypothetical protein
MRPAPELVVKKRLLNDVNSSGAVSLGDAPRQEEPRNDSGKAAGIKELGTARGFAQRQTLSPHGTAPAGSSSVVPAIIGIIMTPSASLGDALNCFTEHCDGVRTMRDNDSGTR